LMLPMMASADDACAFMSSKAQLSRIRAEAF
jgi:hypothetical protein